MAAHFNRSPSPLSSRPINPNSRNPENQSVTRRSFNGTNPFPKPSALTNPRKFDPVTPANSPSDFARRRPVGKEGSGYSLKNCEEKENDERDQMLKTSRHQSPAKGSKNFMAPTISAASKFTPSPRKKPLVERNEPVRTSVSLSDGKAMFFSNVSEDLEPKPEMGYHQNQKIPTSLDLKVNDSEKKEFVQEDPPVTKPYSKKVTFLDVPQDSQITTESFSSDGLEMESSSNINISCSPIPTPIAPLDADPSMPPYDPKTNYLSPRPQFLYYKPNPRIEVLKGIDTDDSLPLEDDTFMKEFISDNFSSDTEGAEEDPEKEKLEAIASPDMVIGLDMSEDDYFHVSKDSEKEKLEAIASADVVEQEFSEEKHDFHVWKDSEKEKLKAVDSADRVMGLQETVDVDDLIFHVEINEKKSWGIAKMMCFSTVMMMLLMAACVSVSMTRPPSFEEFGLVKDLSFSELKNLYHQSRVVAFEKLNLDRVARRINQFSVDCVNFVSKVVCEIGKGETTMGSVKYMNLSDMQISSWDDKVHFMNNNEVSLVESVQDDELDEDLGTETEIFEEENEAYVENDDGSDEGLEMKLENLGEEKEARGGNNDDSDETFENQINTHYVSEIEETMDFENQIDTHYVSEIEEKMDFEYSEDAQSQKEINVPSISIDHHLLAAVISRDQESEAEAEIEMIPSEIVEIEKINCDISPVSDTTLSDQDSPSDVNSLTQNVQNPIIPESSPSLEDNNLLAHYYYYAIGISSFFAALLAFAGFTYHYKRNPNPGLANVVVQCNKQKEYEISRNIKQMYQEKKKAVPSQNWQREVDDDDIIGESSLCPSVMSSFQKSASCYNNNKKEMRGASEVQSMERKTRKYYSKRESLASSSSEFTTTGSPSYGSFTTFEKIPIKNANGEEEIITPVRRSSRIRSHHQIISP